MEQEVWRSSLPASAGDGERPRASVGSLGGPADGNKSPSPVPWLLDDGKWAIVKGFASPLSAALYAIVAVSMGFFNKAVLSIFEFDFPNVLLLAQMLVALLVLYFLRYIGLVSKEQLSFSKARELAPVALLYTANVGFALASLSKLNVPMYNTLKRATPLVVLGWGVVGEGKFPKREVALSVGTTVLGCIVAGIGDISFDLYGYAFAFTSCLLQAAYLITVQKTGAEKGVDSTSLLLYNSLLSIPPLIVLVILDGSLAASLSSLREREELRSGPFLFSMANALLLGVLLNYALFLCTECNSALTTTVVGVIKGVLSTALGFVLLGGVRTNATNILGILLNTCGGVWYSRIKYLEKAAKRERHEISPGLSEIVTNISRLGPR